MRNAIAFVAGPEDRRDRARTPRRASSSGTFAIGRTELIVTVVGLLVIALVAVGVEVLLARPQTRALADSIQLAETTGIDTDRVVLITWAASAGLAGLAGILYALPAGVVNPEPRILADPQHLRRRRRRAASATPTAHSPAGCSSALVQEWSTLVIDPAMKVAVGFAVLILVLLVRPQGLFGRGRSVDR